MPSSNIEVTHPSAGTNWSGRAMDSGRGQWAFMDASSRMPWFVAVFGRDAVVTSLQTMAVSYEFGRGTLIKLAQLQATQVDGCTINPAKFCTNCGVASWQHHMKFHTPYYWQWMLPSSDYYLSRGLSLECWPNMLDFPRTTNVHQRIDKYGDFDGDGFVEYLSRSKVRNQGPSVNFPLIRKPGRETRVAAIAHWVQLCVDLRLCYLWVSIAFFFWRRPTVRSTPFSIRPLPIVLPTRRRRL